MKATKPVKFTDRKQVYWQREAAKAYEQVQFQLGQGELKAAKAAQKTAAQYTANARYYGHQIQSR